MYYQCLKLFRYFHKGLPRHNYLSCYTFLSISHHSWCPAMSILGSDIGRANLEAEIVTTQNHVFSYTITMGAEVFSLHFSSSHACMSDPNGGRLCDVWYTMQYLVTTKPSTLAYRSGIRIELIQRDNYVTLHSG